MVSKSAQDLRGPRFAFQLLLLSSVSLWWGLDYSAIVGVYFWGNRLKIVCVCMCVCIHFRFCIIWVLIGEIHWFAPWKEAAAETLLSVGNTRPTICKHYNLAHQYKCWAKTNEHTASMMPPVLFDICLHSVKIIPNTVTFVPCYFLFNLDQKQRQQKKHPHQPVYWNIHTPIKKK